jgi:hypothetical protein
MRVLVAFEDDYRSYRETIAAAIQGLRPGLEVDSVALGGLEEELARLDPQVVVCGRPNAPVPDDASGDAGGRGPTWITLPTDDLRQPAEIFYADGGHRETRELLMPELLVVLDEVEGRLLYEGSS